MAVVNPRGGCDYLTWQRSTVKTPYRNTKRPTRAAGNSIPVYQPSQAKYRPIFSPKYLLERRNPGGIGRTEGKKSSGSYKKAHSSRAASVLVFWEMSKTLPDEVQWLILVPSPPPGPALVQQVQVVLCSVRSDWIFAVILPLTWKDTHYTLFGQSHLMNNLAKCQKKRGKAVLTFFERNLPHGEGKLPRMNYCLKDD